STSISGTAGALDIGFDLNGKVYEVYPTSVVRSNLDGTNVETLASALPSVTNAGIAVDAVHGWVFWTNGSTIYRQDVDDINNARGSRITQSTGVSNTTSIAVDPTDGHIYWGESQGSGLIIKKATLDLQGVTQLSITQPGSQNGNRNVQDLALDP